MKAERKKQEHRVEGTSPGGEDGRRSIQDAINNTTSSYQFNQQHRPFAETAATVPLSGHEQKQSWKLKPGRMLDEISINAQLAILLDPATLEDEMNLHHLSSYCFIPGQSCLEFVMAPASSRQPNLRSFATHHMRKRIRRPVS